MDAFAKQELKQMIQEEATRIARKEIDDARKQAGYGVSLIPFHTHNNLNSPLVDTIVVPLVTGAPTKTPPISGTMVYDKTNNKLYVYNGAWKSVTLT